LPLRIAWFSNAPWTPTGYGTQTAQVTRRLLKDGHDVAVLANWGLNGAVQINDGLTVYPAGVAPYSTDIVDFETRMHFQDEDGLVITLYDVWPLVESGHDPFKDFRVASWVPIDHDPVPPKVVPWISQRDTIAMSLFGQRKMAEVGVESTYIPHAIEPIFRPTESEVRKAMKVPEDAFLVMVNAANIGVWPPRKSWWQMLIGFRLLAERHDDAFLYLHTALWHPRGLNLAELLLSWGIPRDRFVIADQPAYASGMLTQDHLAELYTAADVLLSPSMGEGFAAQPELVGAGWKVPYTQEWDYGQQSTLARPDLSGVVAALEEAYATKGDAELRTAALAKAAEYDADKVFDEYWRPYLADWEQRIHPPLNRQQRRAARKAA
jgi:glycosyltransferase involved in cell wall biosynthesis